MPAEQENKMGTMPVRKLLITMSLPMIISMLVQAMYNVVDSIFVSRLGENALAAVSLAFPVQNLMIAVASGTGVGINALLSRSLGEKNFDNANKAAVNGLFLALLSSLAFAVFGIFFSEFYFSAQIADPQIIQYGRDYLFVCCTFSVGLFFAITSERLLQSTGRTIYNMITQGLGAIINIIMDPILIFGLFGFPRMEVAGAAVATVAGQIIGMLLSLFFNFTKNKDIHIQLRGFRPHGETITNIYRVGLPSIIMMSIGSVMTYGINKIMLMFSATAVSVFGIYFKLQSFIFMPVFGLNNGMVPIIAYNYGARRPSRILQTVRFGALLAEIIMFIGTVIFQTCPAFLLALFDASDDMLALGIPALRIISINFLFAGLGISFGSVFQAMGNGMYSLIVSACRQLVVLLPVAYLLAVTMGVHFVWWAFPASELASIVLSVVLFLRIYRKKIQPLYEEAEV